MSTAVPLFAVLGAQGLAMGVDELHFHRARGLPRWERLGHPLDTLTVIACFTWMALNPPTASHLWIYSALAGFSCLFVTKDEFVHSKRCTPGENWLHGVLFVLHPIVLGAAALWAWIPGRQEFLLGQLAVLIFFGLYQLLYWSYAWKPAAQQLTTPSTRLSASVGTPPTTIPSPCSEPSPN